MLEGGQKLPKKLDGAAIKTLVRQRGKDTVAVTGDETLGNAAHIKELGAALQQAN